MKANELMVGDLVRVSKDVCIEKGAIVRVHAIDGDNNIPKKGLKGCATCVRINDPYRMSGGVWAEYLEPIPLTPEILEKNGFKKKCSGYTWEYAFSDKSSLVTISISLVELREEGEVFVFNKETEKHMKLYFRNRSISSFCYLHELQHALRMCEIEKEVEL